MVVHDRHAVPVWLRRCECGWQHSQRRVSSMTLWDLQVAYRGIRGLTLTLGAKNIFDTNPPLTNQQTTFQVGFDPSYYDARSPVRVPERNVFLPLNPLIHRIPK